jgi:hypothetical protein
VSAEKRQKTCKANSESLKKIMVRRSSRRNVQIRGFFARNSSFKARSSEETDKLTGITPMQGGRKTARHWMEGIWNMSGSH